MDIVSDYAGNLAQFLKAELASGADADADVVCAALADAALRAGAVGTLVLGLNPRAALQAGGVVSGAGPVAEALEWLRAQPNVDVEELD